MTRFLKQNGECEEKLSRKAKKEHAKKILREHLKDHNFFVHENFPFYIN